MSVCSNYRTAQILSIVITSLTPAATPTSVPYTRKLLTVNMVANSMWFSMQQDQWSPGAVDVLQKVHQEALTYV